MQVRLESQHPETDEAAKAATGRTFEEWFQVLDERGGPAQGRRAINDFLYGECKVDAWWCPTINIRYEAARGVVEKDGRPKGYTICATKTIAAPVAKVYAAWASGEALSRWFGEATQAEVADGGSYRNADGDAGVFKRVRPNKDLRLTWENPAVTPGSLADVAFQGNGNGKTGVLVTHDRIQTRAEADGLRAGWLEALDRLKALVETD
jgi:uncharacterized protein YndB with AHSA1/START domain